MNGYTHGSSNSSLLFSFGLLLVAIPVQDYCSTPSLQETRQERAYIASWPNVTGQLDVVHLVEVNSTIRATTWYQAEVEYRYRVGGKEYRGERLTYNTYDRSPYHQRHWSELHKNMNRFISGARYVKKESVDPGLAANSRTSYYLSNHQVVVHYDPQRPESSILDTFDYDPPSLINLLLFSMAFSIPGILFIVMSFFLWRQAVAKRGTEGFPSRNATWHPADSNRRSRGRDGHTSPQQLTERSHKESVPVAVESASRPGAEWPSHPKKVTIPDIDRIGCACPRLPTKYRNGFPTDWDWTQAEALLIAELNAGNMNRLPDPDFDTPFFHDYFECKHCGTYWKLSHPDQAYRGGLQILEDRTSGGKIGRP